ncbi:hypothetical protein GJ744_001514 [Endocarpon pusillum]|uniref:Uncharacterized protein n=1 Tax=Endocarpon pusillum TaxID=364733 RepID=A0A8H7A9H5_9EURO|nr:hypothetical protein GJ744_001514 [Endocarpon pusillum]
MLYYFRNHLVVSPGRDFFLSLNYMISSTKIPPQPKKSNNLGTECEHWRMAMKWGRELTFGQLEDGMFLQGVLDMRVIAKAAASVPPTLVS